MAKNYSFLEWRSHPLIVAYLNRTPEQKTADDIAFEKFRADAQAAVDKLWASAPCNRGMSPFVSSKPKA